MNTKYGMLISLIFFIFIIENLSAAHYVLGTVDDALDSTSAENHTIFLWNPENGEEDNITDIIGVFGNSGQENNYSLDCELLNTPCIEGEVLTLKVINNGDNYVSEEVNVTVSSIGYSLVQNIKLNSPPNVSLIFPIEKAKLDYEEIEFNCTFEDLDNNLKEISLYGNWSGEWDLNETKEISSGEKFKIFTKKLLQGFYNYACRITDSLMISVFSETNNSFSVDLTAPIIENISLNSTLFCGNYNVTNVKCNAYDEIVGIDKVIIQSISPSNSIINYSAYQLGQYEYYYDIILNELGIWRFNCIVNDSAGNINNLYSDYLSVYSSSPELVINGTNINISKTQPIEYENVNLSAIIENKGCSSAENIKVSFFEGDPDVSGQEIGYININISNLENISVKIPWISKIGKNQIFVFVDYGNIISEENEGDNKDYKNISINAWQEIYGNISLDKIIGGENISIKKWYNESQIQGNIFITDSECDINWMNLEAIGRTKSGEESLNDFFEIDKILRMEDFEDSVSKLFTDSQIPKEVRNMTIYQREIKNIPIINSTDNSNFITGILWDSSDDQDGEFDELDKEDLVFVAEVNKISEGFYGVYDYEIKIPSRLREYILTDDEEVYLYYNLN